MDKRVNEILCGYFQGVQRERALKVFAGDATLEEEKKFFINFIISTKFMVKRYFKYAEKYKDRLNECKAKSDNEKYKIMAEKCQAQYIALIRCIRDLGELLIHLLPMCDELFSDHEIAQVFSTTVNKVKRIRETYRHDNPKSLNMGFLLYAVCSRVIEHRGDYKGMCDKPNEWYDIQAPLFSAICHFTVSKKLEERQLKDNENVQ